MRGNSDSYETEIKFQRWDKEFFYLSDELYKILTLGNVVYQDFKNIFPYYAAIMGVYDNYHTYLNNPEKIFKELINIEKILFSPVFKQSLGRGVTPEHLKILHMLKATYRQIGQELSENGMRVKAEKRYRKASDNENLTEEEREELRDLEEVGLA